ncbi:MAG: sigma-54 dependent transcriptional regulator [Gemmataceae bacterium]|jgi:two-component system nitrogen regulation response regulator GlnG|nr:sigma-54 dependent transcriptional regulator [Gemmataceae bacterium]
MNSKILIIDDEEAIAWALTKAFQREGAIVWNVGSAEAGLTAAKKYQPEVIFLDIRLPKQDGLSVLQELREVSGGAAIIVITAHGNLNTAVKAVELGAFDYLTKPFDLSQAIETAKRASLSKSQGQPIESFDFSEQELVGHSPSMQAVFKRIALVAATDASVLITGESGTGKELVARAIHNHSLRKDKPFVPVHIAALNPNLIESELFGHTKGAYTGAGQSRLGLLSLANGGTIFLDELGDVPLAVQAKLLRVLEHQEVLPVGAINPLPIQVRILAATNANLAKMVEKGEFRHDLYYRLNVFEISLPALRERKEDIPLLIKYFLRKLGSQSSLPKSTEEFLVAREWKGNVRELRNALEHASILARGGPLLPEHFPTETISSPLSTQSIQELVASWVKENHQNSTDLYDQFLAWIEPHFLREVLDRCEGSRNAAAKKLGLARATLRRMLAKYQINTTLSEPDDESDLK